MMFPILPPISIIHAWSQESIGSKVHGMNGGTLVNVVSAVYPSANLAIYIPFSIGQPVTVAQLWWYNGGTASGNVDVGIYTADGRRITSTGSTAQSGVSSLQAVDITDIQIGAGLFFIAIAMNNTTGTLRRVTAGGVGLLCTTGMYQQATAFPLPDPATFALPTSDYVPVFGFTPGSVL